MAVCREVSVIDVQTVTELAQMLDLSTRTELLRNFQEDATGLINTMETATGKELADTRHGLVGIAGMIGARRLQHLAQDAGTTAPALHEALAQTLVCLESEFLSASAQERE